MIKENECGSADSIGIVLEDGTMLFAEYDLSQVQENNFAIVDVRSHSNDWEITTDELSIGDVIPLEVAKEVDSRYEDSDHTIESFIVPDHTLHFFTSEFPSYSIHRQTDHPSYQNGMRNRTDYKLPENWGIMTDDERSFWLFQERNYRQAMQQDTVWGKKAREFHSDSDYKVDGGDLQ